jgi:hypothetical protein
MTGKGKRKHSQKNLPVSLCPQGTAQCYIIALFMRILTAGSTQGINVTIQFRILY